MLYLWLAISCSTLIALILKHAETRNLNRYAVLSANYLMASSISLALILLSPEGFNGFDLGEGFSALAALLEDPVANANSAASMTWGVLVGLVAGGFFFGSFFCYQVSVKQHGVALASAFLKLGFLLPTFLSMLLWREFPQSRQWIGILLAVAAMGLVNWPFGMTWRQALRPVLIALCLIGGMSQFSSKLFQKFGFQEHKAFFLLATFCVAFLFSSATLYFKRQPLKLRDFGTGLVLGIPNIFSSFFLVKALSFLPAAVAFPLFSAGTICLVYLVGFLFFGERPLRRETAAIALIVLAMVFI